MGMVAVDVLYDKFGAALCNGTGAIFVGAGLSCASGCVNWRGLLRGIAKDLELDIDRESDLISVAQYHVNKRGGQRGELNQLIVDEFAKKAKASENHQIIAHLPLHTVWTTNYDRLLEEAFEAAHRPVDVKTSQKSLAISHHGHAATIYKMHGDVSDPSGAILTKEDYETFEASRGAFSIKLKGDLLSRTFLFLGFSFSDPNIDYILARIRALVNKDCRPHYCIMSWPKRPEKMRGNAKAAYEYERKRLSLRLGDLSRYGIQAVMINEYAELTPILRELGRRSHQRDIFVSGSAHDYSPFEEDRLKGLARHIGNRLAAEGYNLTSGFGLGIGEHVILGALENLLQKPVADLDSRLFLRPFPQSPPTGISRKDFWTKYRREMLQRTGACIFIAGNKFDRTSNNVVEADGMIEEFEIACSFNQYPIPIGATGHAAKHLWERVMDNLDHYFPKIGVKQFFKTLGDQSKTDHELLDAVFAILKRIGTSR